MRRASIEDRAKEILEKARSAAPRVSEESDSGPSLQATFAELMEGIEIPKDRQTTNQTAYDISSPKASSAFDSKSAAQKRVVDTPGDSSYGDSFELSAADLEVGTFAAKRMREKSAERGRRMSFDQPNFKEQKELQTFAKKSAASPDPAKSRKSLGDFQISTALSSIQRSKSFTADPDFRGPHALSADNNLNSVDEIMQRWYNADSNTLMKSLDDIGRSRSQSQDTLSATAAAAKPSLAGPSPATSAVPRSSAPSPVELAPAPVSTATGSAATLDAPLAADKVQAATDALGDASAKPAVAGIALASQLDIPTWDDADDAALSDTPTAAGAKNELSDGEREHRSRPARGSEAPIDSRRDAGGSTASPAGTEHSQRSEAKSRTRYSSSEPSQSDPDRSVDRSAGDEEDDEDLRRWRSRSRSKSPAAT
eukprot:gene18146-13025_t